MYKTKRNRKKIKIFFLSVIYIISIFFNSFPYPASLAQTEPVKRTDETAQEEENTLVNTNSPIKDDKEEAPSDNALSENKNQKKEIIDTLVPQKNKEAVVLTAEDGNDKPVLIFPKNDTVPTQFLTSDEQALAASYIYLRTAQKSIDVPKTIPYRSQEESSPVFSFIDKTRDAGLSVISSKVEETADRYKILLGEELDGIPVMGQHMTLTIAKETGKIISMVGKLNSILPDATQIVDMNLAEVKEKFISQWKELGYVFADNEKYVASESSVYYFPDERLYPSRVRLGYLFQIHVLQPFGFWEVLLDAEEGSLIFSRNIALMQEENTGEIHTPVAESGSGTIIINTDNGNTNEEQAKEEIIDIPSEENNTNASAQETFEELFQIILSGNIVEGITDTVTSLQVPFPYLKVILKGTDYPIYTDKNGALINITKDEIRRAELSSNVSVELSSSNFSIIDDDISQYPVALSVEGLLSGSGTILSSTEESKDITGSGDIVSLLVSRIIPLWDSTAFYYTQKAFHYVENTLHLPLPKVFFHTNSHVADSTNKVCQAFYIPWKNEVHTGRCNGGESNLALRQSIIFHELGHSFVENLKPFVSYNDDVRLMREGISDFFATVMTNTVKQTVSSPVDYYGIQSYATADCTKTFSYFLDPLDTIESYTGTCSKDTITTYISDRTGEAHADGHIISGILWEISQKIGIEKTTQLLFAALKNQTGSLDMLLYNMLIEDDSVMFGGDNNLATGTPDANVLFQVFYKHGVGPGYSEWLKNGFNPSNPDPTDMPDDPLLSGNPDAFQVDCTIGWDWITGLGTWVGTENYQCCGNDAENDDFATYSGNLTTSTSVNCTRCLDGFDYSPTTYYGNGSLSGSGTSRTCYYGNITCSETSGAHGENSVVHGWGYYTGDLSTDTTISCKSGAATCTDGTATDDSSTNLCGNGYFSSSHTTCSSSNKATASSGYCYYGNITCSNGNEENGSVSGILYGNGYVSGATCYYEDITCGDNSYSNGATCTLDANDICGNGVACTDCTTTGYVRQSTSACYTSCTTNDQCATDYLCSGSNCIMDPIPHAPTLVSPSNGSYINDDTPTLSAHYYYLGGVGTTNYRIAASAGDCTSGTNIIASGTSAQTSTNNQDTTWTPGSSIGSDATYYWCAQNDNSVQQSAWTSMGNFILDTQAPSVSADNSSSSWYTSNQTITLSTSDAGSSGLSYSKYSWDSNDGTCRSSGTSFTNGNTITIPSEASHTLYLCNADVAGNTASWNGPYKLDIVTPTVSLNSIAGDASAPYYDTANDSATSLILNVADSTSGVSNCRYATTNIAYASMVNNCAAPSGGTSTCSLGALSENSYTYYYACIDTAGNASTTQSVAFIVDWTVPTVSVNNVAGDTTSLYYDVINDSATNLVLNVSDATSGALNCKYATTNIAYASMVNNCGTPSESLSTCALGALAQNSYTYYYACIDNAGNTRATQSVAFKVDWTAPTISITNVAGDINDPYFDSTDDSSTTVVYSTPTDTADCKWSTENVAYDSMSSCSSDSSKSSCYLNLSGNGDKTVYLRCMDNAGNKASSSYELKYTIDSVAPTIGSLTLSSPYWKTDNTSQYTITIKASDAGSIVRRILALVDGSSTYGGTFDWDYFGYNYGYNNIVCSGDGGFGSRGGGVGLITLVSCSSSLSGNERTVTFTVRPNINYVYSEDSGIIHDIIVNAKDRAQNESSTAFNDIFSTDHTAPSVSVHDIDGDTADPYYDSVNNSATSLVLNVSDPASGISTCKYATTNVAYGSMPNTCATPTGGTSTCSLGALTQNNYTYYYACIDNAGNTSATQSVAFAVDAPPSITAITSVAGDSSAPYYDTTDDGSTVLNYSTTADATNCKWHSTDIDYDSMTNCSSASTCTLNLSGEGAKTVYMRCIDDTGNKADTSYTLNYTIDTTAPTVSVNNISEDTTAPYYDTTNNSATNLIVNVTDTASGISACKYATTDIAYASMVNDCGAPSEETSACNLGALDQNSYTYYYACIDNAGNASSTQSVEFTVDWTAPTTAPTCTPESSYFSSATETIACSVGTGGTVIRYTSDGSAPSSSSSVWNDQAFSATTTLKVISCDDSNNCYLTPATYTYTKDTTGPTGSITHASGNPTNNDTPTLNLSIADAGVGISGAQMQFSCDNATWSALEAYATPKTNFDIKPDVTSYGCETTDGSRTVYVRFQDSLGNTGSSYNTGAFTLDTTAPEASGSATALSATSIQWSISASDNGSGLHSSSAYTFDGTNWQAENTSTDTELTPNTQYTKATMKVRDNVLNQTSISSVSRYTLSSDPTGATFVGNGWQADPAGYYIDLSWSSGGSQAGYKVYSSSDNYTSPICTTTETTCRHSGLSENESYTYRIYSYNGDSINSTNYTSVAGNSNITLSLSVTSGENIDFNTLSFNTLHNAESVLSVTTNASNGYNLFISDGKTGTNSALYNASSETYISDYTGTITTPTTWSGNGLGICIYSATDKDSKWGTGTTSTDSNNKYAGVPETSTQVYSKTGYSSAADTTKVSYGLQVSTDQLAGTYTGSIIYSVVANP